MSAFGIVRDVERLLLEAHGLSGIIHIYINFLLLGKASMCPVLLAFFCRMRVSSANKLLFPYMCFQET